MMKGAFASYIQSNFIGFFRSTSYLYCILILFSFFNLSLSLYEDQIGKFDWKQSYVGKIKFSQFDTVSAAKKIIVATEDNVIAALSIKSGQILWRHVLESTAQGNIQMLHVSDEVVTVSGSNPVLIRGWNNTTGFLLWEWSLWLQVSLSGAQWWVDGDILHHLIPVAKSHLELTSYNLRTGQNRGATSKFPAAWISHRCVLSGSYYTCITGGEGPQMQLISMDVTSKALQIFTKTVNTILPNMDHVEMKPLPGGLPGIVLNKKVIMLEPGSFKVTDIELNDEKTPVNIVKHNGKDVLLQSRYADESIHVSAVDLESGSSIQELSNSVSLPGANTPKIESSMCTKTARNNLACRILLSGEDEMVYLIQNPGRLVWTREEALARITGVEMLDLPVSELDAVIETEFDDKEGDILSMFMRRVKSQVSQLKTLLHSMQVRWSEEMEGEMKTEDPLIRDEFGLHKIIIVATSVGKIFAIDNLSGNIIWKRYIPFLSPFSGNSPYNSDFTLIYVQRTTRHLPYDAQCAIVGRHKLNGKGIIFVFNPITGAAQDIGIANLNYKIKQVTSLNHWNSEFIKGVVILDENDEVHVYPPSCTEHVHNIYMFVADVATASVNGYVITNEKKNLGATKVWTLKLGGGNGHKIINIATKNPLERVHSQGKVMGDRSVLYKYINPNLVTFVTEGSDPMYKCSLNVFMVDVVSGNIMFVQSHKRAKGPVRVVHSENWLVYSYYNEKVRRPEVGSVELYEGPHRWGSTTFSSLRGSPFPPEAARQAFVLPATTPPHTMAVTITDRGITAKDVLFSMSTGTIVELPFVLLDPRRPTVPMTPEAREEGLIQYTPELPLPSDTVINYNQTLQNIRNIHTSPSGLESTCLLFAYGLDIFYTRVAPSKTFDLLKEDFDYTLIAIVLISLIIASDAAKRFASRKVLRQAWK